MKDEAVEMSWTKATRDQHTTMALSKLKRSDAKVMKNLGTTVLFAVSLVFLSSLHKLNRESCIIYLCIFKQPCTQSKVKRWLTKADRKNLVGKPFAAP